jgi:hypothetical protein
VRRRSPSLRSSAGLAALCSLRACALADEHLTEEQSDMIESASELLYGLIHARFILTSRGMAVMVSHGLLRACSTCSTGPIVLSRHSD